MAEQSETIDAALAERCAQEPDLALSHLRALFDCLVSGDETLREWTIEAFENCGPPSEEHLEWIVEKLGSREGDQSYWAATLLGRLQERASLATSQLIAMILDADQSEAARQRAAWALGRIGGLSAPDQDQLRVALAKEKSGMVRKMIEMALNDSVP